MGQEEKRPIRPQKSLQEHIIDMKINAKQIARAAKTAQKQSEKYKKQAKDALKKNNQDFAKLYLASASQKRNQSLNYQRTAVKMELMCDQIKSMKNNQKMMNTFGVLSQAVNTQIGQTDTIKMAQSMQLFNDKMDQVFIDNKMMSQLMNPAQSDFNTDNMLDTLKQEILLQQKNNLDIKIPQQTYKIPNQQQQQQNQPQGLQVPQKKVEQVPYDPFLDQLKGL